MKKVFFKAAIFALILSSFSLQSCIGSFSLTHKVIKWNNQVGSKFLNELVFIAFWILPVYEVTAVADLLVINSIEFWSGSNPVEAFHKTVETDHGTYFIACDSKGYSITCPDGSQRFLDFSEKDQTWSLRLENGENYPFMTFLDDSHVKMVTPSGEFKEIELNNDCLMAYSQIIKAE